MFMPIYYSLSCFVASAQTPDAWLLPPARRRGKVLALASKLLAVYACRGMLRNFTVPTYRRIERAVLILDEASRMTVSTTFSARRASLVANALHFLVPVVQDNCSLNGAEVLLHLSARLFTFQQKLEN